MAFDLNNLSPKELDALISNAKQRKVALKKRKPVAAVREKLARAAATEGYSLDELFAGAAASTPATTKRASKRGAKKAAGAKRAARRGRPPGVRAGSKVPAKYRNPANQAEVWSGRGMPPRWMAEYLRQGKSKDEFLI